MKDVVDETSETAERATHPCGLIGNLDPAFVRDLGVAVRSCACDVGLVDFRS